MDISAKELNSDLEKISKQAFQWKMQLNPDPKKQTNEVIFSRKANNSSHPLLLSITMTIINILITIIWAFFQIQNQTFNFILIKKFYKCNKLIGLIRTLSDNVSRKALLTIYKSFVRPHLDYGVILYDKPEIENFQNKLEKVQYRGCLAITCVIQGKSRQNFTTTRSAFTK